MKRLLQILMLLLHRNSSVCDDVTKKEDKRGPFGGLKFHRVVLDEAHLIQRRRCLVSQACNRIINSIEATFPLIGILRLAIIPRIRKFLYILQKVHALLQSYSFRRLENTKTTQARLDKYIKEGSVVKKKGSSVFDLLGRFTASLPSPEFDIQVVLTNEMIKTVANWFIHEDTDPR
ncbi:hypothetical protein BDC45DRAFT_587545 [Circinella umbellata]|nr:hypothetical protein BDC45DRAFT_587545 [Circinella umbellata]